MAAYAQFGYSYPTENEMLTGTTDSQSGHGASPLSNTNEASLSPSGCSTTTGITTGPLSPGANSQSSNNAGHKITVSSAIADGEVGNEGPGPVKVLETDIHAHVSESTSCCENGRPIITDPVTGQTVCSCQYESTRLTIGGYSRMALPSAGMGVYGGPYPSNEQNPYPSIGVDNSAFYAPLSNPYGMKDTSAGSDMNAWASAGLQSTTGYYSYDPTLAAYGYGPNYDLAARRKNATRESTATLKAWLSEHKKNPYPTKGEKIMLAIITKMTLTQVSTWFANARRRLKKENKMTWEPKNKTEDDDDNLMSDDEKEKDACDGLKSSTETFDPSNQLIKSELGKTEKETDGDQKIEREPTNMVPMRGIASYGSTHFNTLPMHSTYTSYAHGQHQQQQQQPADHQHPPLPAPYFHSGYSQEEGSDYAVQKNPLSRDCGIPVPANKPKIWSVADTVACKTPPPTAYIGQNFYPQAQVSASVPGSQLQHQHHMSSPQSQPLVMHSNNMTMGGPQVDLSSPLSMMNSYAAASPYSRIPTVYTEAMGMHIGPGAGMVPGAGAGAGAGAGTVVTNKAPTTINIHRDSYPPPPIPTRMGFSEIQPDTPPQTPPNMKLNNHTTNNNSNIISNNTNNNNNNNNNSSSSNNSSSNNNNINNNSICSSIHSLPGPVSTPVVSMMNIVYSTGGSGVYANSSSYLTGSRSGS